MKLLISKCHFQLSLTLVVFGLFVLVANTDMIIVKAQQEQHPQEQQPHIFKIQPVTRLGDNNKNKNKNYINKKKQQIQTLQQFFDNVQLVDSYDMNNHQQVFGNKDTTKYNNVIVNDKICIQCEKGRNTHRNLKHNTTVNKNTPPTTKTTTTSTSTALVNSTDATDRIDLLPCILLPIFLVTLFTVATLIPSYTYILFLRAIQCVLPDGPACPDGRQLLFLALVTAVGFVFFPFILIESIVLCGTSTKFIEQVFKIVMTIYTFLTGETFDAGSSNIMGTVDIPDLTAILAQLQHGGDNGRQRQRQRRHRLMLELDNTEEALLTFNHMDTIFEKILTSTTEFLVNDVTSSQHSVVDDGDNTAEYHYHNIGKRFLQQQQELLFSTSNLMNLTTSLRNIPQILLQNEFIQDLLESVLQSMTNETTKSTTTSASNVTAIPFNRTELSSMIIQAMNELPHYPNGIDALLDFNFDDKTMIELRKFSSSLLSDPTILDDIHRRMLKEEEDPEDDEEQQEECSIEQRMLCMTRSLFDNVNLIPV